MFRDDANVKSSTMTTNKFGFVVKKNKAITIFSKIKRKSEYIKSQMSDYVMLDKKEL